MRFRRDASLDTSQVSDRRGMGMGGLTLGGGGIIGLIFLVIQLLNNGGSAGLPQIGGAQQGSTGDLAAQCQTGEDANQRTDCLVVGVVNSVQAFWETKLSGYQPATTVFFQGGVNTGCGSATSAAGPFYCPVDKHVYIDLGFYDDLRTKFGASGGPFAEAYVIAHEYGHHVQDLMGTLSKGSSGATGPQSAGVRLELQADCLAGMWANGAVQTGFIDQLTDADIADGLNAAASIGDDRLQKEIQGEVHPESFTHGTSAQRQKWFLKGYKDATLKACDTFAVSTA